MPKGALITDANRNLIWDSCVRWNINIHHNTFVNFGTHSNQVIVNTRYNPGASYLAFHDNIMINTKDEADQNRNIGNGGWETVMFKVATVVVHVSSTSITTGLQMMAI